MNPDFYPWGHKVDEWIANHAWPLWLFMHRWLCPGCWRERRRDAR